MIFGQRSRARAAAAARAAERPAEPDIDSVQPVARTVAETVPPGMVIAGAWAWRVLLILGVLGVVAWLVIQLEYVVIPLFLAIVLAALLVPISNWMQRHHVPKWLAVAISEIGVIVAVAALVYLVTTQIIGQYDSLRAQTLTRYADLRGFLTDGPLQLSEQQLNDAYAQAVDAVQRDAGALLSGALSVTSSLGHVLTGVLLVLFSTLFILIDGAGMWRWVVRLFPRLARPAVDGAGKAGWSTLQNFVKVQVLVALIDAVGIAGGAAIIGVPLAIPIGVLVFLGSFIPIVGAVVTGTLAVFVALVYNGLTQALIMVGIVLLVQQVEGHVLQPLIMGSVVKVHPLAVVLSVAAGGMVAGIAGTFFAVPLVATLNSMVKHVASGAWRGQPEPPPPAVPADAAPHADLPHLRAVGDELDPSQLGEDAAALAGELPRGSAPTLARIEAARAVVSRVAEVTPMESSRFLAEILGSPVYLKCENLQRTGSYKIRGAYNRISRLTDEEKARGVVAASAGNHAQGVAFAARELGIRATIFMPVGVALPKLQATRQYGAEVILRGHTVAEPLLAAAEFAAQTGAVLIPPFDHEDVITGQATLGLEILDQTPDVETVVVPIGGGGLISGVATALKLRAAEEGRTIRVVGVQARNAAAYPPSLAAGRATEIEITPTIADGIAVAKPGLLNFDIIRESVDEVVTVEDDDTARALLLLLERAKLVVEPAGAVGVAAILAGLVTDAGRTVVILSGGNIDPLMMERVISRGLAASDRYVKLRIMLPDRPGQLARTSQIISEANANVVEVLHTRHGRGLQISEVELEVSVETRGPEHTGEVVQRLRDAGYDPRLQRD